MATTTINKLLDSQCRAARAETKAKKLFDGAGLFLYVSPTGLKSWRLAYRHQGKPKTITFGPYPAVSLSDARAKRDAAKAALRDGVDPMVVKRPSTEPTITLSDANAAYWAGRQDLSPSYISNAQRGIEQHLCPALGCLAMRDIDRTQLLGALLAMDEAGRSVYVRKVRMWVSQVFDWAIETGRADTNPAATIDPRKAFSRRPVEHFAALREVDVPRLVNLLFLEMPLSSALACWLLALTWTRTKELRFMRWDQIEGDVWRVPASVMKSREYHLVPLSRQAKDVLQTMKLRSRGSAYVFPAEHRLDRPISNNAVLALLYRLGYKGKMTGHGWRSVGSTWANERGYEPDAVEYQLAHTPADRVRAIYNRAAYLPQRTRLLQDWADWLTSHVDSRVDQR